MGMMKMGEEGAYQTELERESRGLEKRIALWMVFSIKRSYTS